MKRFIVESAVNGGRRKDRAEKGGHSLSETYGADGGKAGGIMRQVLKGVVRKPAVCRCEEDDSP